MRTIRATIIPNEVFEGKYGFYPCSYETYRQIKRLNFISFKAVQRQAEWERWYRKQPQNRVIREWIKDEKGRKIGSKIIGPRLEPIRIPTHNIPGYIENMYKLARYPKVKKEDVEYLGYTAQEIDTFLKREEEDLLQWGFKI